MIIKPEFIRGNRGREAQMSWKEAVTYNGNSRSEKGREESIILDRGGQEITADQALEALGGEEARYTAAIINLSDEERAFWEEKCGGRREAQEAIGRAVFIRTGENGVAFIHDHGDKGWHLHVAFEGHPQRLFKAHGRIQAALDREEEVLRGESGSRIQDWGMHREHLAKREKIKVLRAQRRELDNARFRALKDAKTPEEKAEIRDRFQGHELRLIETIRLTEIESANLRYRSRGTEGNHAHLVEIERIEKAAALSVTRMDTRSAKEDLRAQQKGAWKQFRDLEKRHKVLAKTLEAERLVLRKAAGEEREQAILMAEKRGRENTPEHQENLRFLDARAGYRERELDMRIQEEEARYRRDRTVAFAKGPLSRTYLEARETERLVTLAGQRKALEVSWVNQRHEFGKTIGSSKHQKDLSRVESRHDQTVKRLQERVGQGRGMKQASRPGSGAKRKAVHIGKRGAKRVSQVLGQAVKEAKDQLKSQAKDLKPKQPENRDLKRLEGGVKSVGREATRAALRASAAAIKAAGKTAWHASYAGASATVKVAAGVVLALPTKGASLKTASQEAGKDLKHGAKKSAQEAARGAKKTCQEALKGAGRTSIATAKGIGGLSKELLPKEAGALLGAAKEAAKSGVEAASKAIRLDLAGAGRTAALGALKTGKAASKAALKSKELPATLKTPLKIAEKIPVVGQIATAAKIMVETTSTLAHTAEFEL